MTNPVMGRVDAVVGDGIEMAVAYKHRRRLGRLGWGHVFEPSIGCSSFRGCRDARGGCSVRSRA